MAMSLSLSNLRLTEAKFFGKPWLLGLSGYIKADGSVPLTGNWNAGQYTITAKYFQGWNTVDVVNVKNAHGAKGDAIAIAPGPAGGSMLTGSNTLIVGSPTFDPGDVGKYIMVQQCGALGRTLGTTITGFTSTTEVTLALPNASGGDKVDQLVVYGTDDTLAFQNCAAALRQYQSMYIPTGQYIVGTFCIDKAFVKLEGEGRYGSLLINKVRTTANPYVSAGVTTALGSPVITGLTNATNLSVGQWVNINKTGEAYPFPSGTFGGIIKTVDGPTQITLMTDATVAFPAGSASVTGTAALLYIVSDRTSATGNGLIEISGINMQNVGGVTPQPYGIFLDGQTQTLLQPYVHDCFTGGFSIGLSMYAVSEGLFTSNTFDGCAVGAIIFASRFSQFIGNLITFSAQEGLQVSTDGIINQYGNLIADNIIQQAGYSGMLIQGQRGISIVGNNIDGASKNAPNTYPAIKLDNTTNAVISNNFTTHELADPPTNEPARTKYGIELTATATDNRISCNVMTVGVIGAEVSDLGTGNYTVYGGKLAANDGTAAIPAYSFVSEPNTGVFRSGAGEISVSVLGASVAEHGFAGAAPYFSIPSNTGIFFLGAAFDVGLTRRTAANLNLGLADVAAPVAQTLSVQRVATGSVDVASPDFVIQGSGGTGTASAGAIIFQNSVARDSGFLPHSFVETMRLRNVGNTVTGVSWPQMQLWGELQLSGGTDAGFYITSIDQTRDTATCHGLLVNTVNTNATTRIALLTSNGATVFTAMANGNVGIGVSPNVNRTLDVYRPTTGAAAQVGVYSRILRTDALGSTMAILASPELTGTGGTNTTVYGVQSGISSSVNGTITNGRAYNAFSLVGAGTTVTNNVRFYAAADPSTGTITNDYGLYVDALTRGVTLNWAIFTAGATASWLTGNLRIGSAGNTDYPAANPSLYINQSTATYEIATFTNSYTAAITNGAILGLRSKGNGVNGGVNNAQLFAGIQLYGYNSNSAWDTAGATIAAVATQSHTNAAQGTKLEFYTTVDGSAAATKFLTLPSGGGLLVHNATEPTVGANEIGIGTRVSNTASDVGAIALPAHPEGFWIINIGGTDQKVPYYKV